MNRKTLYNKSKNAVIVSINEGKDTTFILSIPTYCKILQTSSHK